MNPADIADSNPRTVGKLLKVLTYSSNVAESANHASLYQAIDEYFRKKFRKLDAEEALEILIPLGEDTTRKLTYLDDKFWVWETLEEAVKPAVDGLDDKGVVQVMKAFATNYKGGQDLWDNLE